MTRSVATVVGAVVMAACATGGVEEGARIPGGQASLACAERLLRTLDYDVQSDERGLWVQGEVRQVAGAAAAVRQLIRVARVARELPTDPDELVVQVSAYQYLPGMTSSPIRRQDVVEVTPSADLLDDAAMLREECRGQGSGA